MHRERLTRRVERKSGQSWVLTRTIPRSPGTVKPDLLGSAPYELQSDSLEGGGRPVFTLSFPWGVLFFMKRHILIILGVSVAAVFVPAFVQRSWHDWEAAQLPPPASEEAGGVSVSVVQPKEEHRVEEVSVFLAAEGKSIEVRVPEGSSVYDVMRIAGDTRGFQFEGREFADLGFFVESVNGKKQDGIRGLYWIYRINGQKAKVGVSGHKVKKNDVIEWRYEKEE